MQYRVGIPVTATTIDGAKRQIDSILANPHVDKTNDLIEWRGDLFGRPSGKELSEIVGYIRDKSDMQVIVTIRSPEERGKYKGHEAHRLALVLSAIEIGAFVDWEYQCYRDKARKSIRTKLGENPDARLILSYHNFDETKDVSAQFGRMDDILLRDNLPTGIVKIATKVFSNEDVTELFSPVKHLDNRTRDIVLVGMADKGYEEFAFKSRVEGPQKHGCLFTFGANDAGEESAPGQPTVANLRKAWGN